MEISFVDKKRSDLLVDWKGEKNIRRSSTSITSCYPQLVIIMREQFWTTVAEVFIISICEEIIWWCLMHEVNIMWDNEAIRNITGKKYADDGWYQLKRWEKGERKVAASAHLQQKDSIFWETSWEDIFSCAKKGKRWWWWWLQSTYLQRRQKEEFSLASSRSSGNIRSRGRFSYSLLFFTASVEWCKEKRKGWGGSDWLSSIHY